MGGGKSRAMCEAIFDYLLDYPGCTALVARDAHTSITNSTKKTMLEQVIPGGADGPLVERSKASQGEDYVKLWNGSEVHFIGMDNPYRWYSSEISIYALDEAQEIPNTEVDKVTRLITRVRERCPDCVRDGVKDCAHFPHKVMLSFNPTNPDHWLREWFYNGAEQTRHGFRKPELFLGEAEEPIGDAEFVIAKATDNPYLSQRYISTLRGLPPHLRRRYLEGLWEYIEGTCFFDNDALQRLQAESLLEKVTLGKLVGDIGQDINQRLRKVKSASPVKVVPGSGPLQIWRTPVRGEKPHRYVIGLDSSSGMSQDWTGMQVLDVDTFEQAAELQLRIPPAEAAEWAYRLGRVYNDALIVCEVTGGWGFAVDQKLRDMRYPKPYTRRVVDRLTKRFTDKLGFDTTKQSRNNILSELEESVRDGSLKVFGPRTLGEMAAFVVGDKDKAEAQPGAHDDLVMSLALAVYVAGTLPKELRRVREEPHRPQVAATGY